VRVPNHAQGAPMSWFWILILILAVIVLVGLLAGHR
jgi:hypothetical protein